MPLPLRPYEWLALLAAALVRVAALLSFEQTLFADHPMVDAHTYWQQAHALADGSDPFAEEGLYQPPGYPVFLAFVGLFTGSPDLGVVRWVQAALGWLTAAGLLLLGRRLGTPAGVPWAGAVAALLFSLYPTTLFFEHDILTPALTSACLAGAVLCVLSARAWPALPGGLLAGLAVVSHPTYLPAALLLGLWRLLGLGLAPSGRRAGLIFLLALGLSLAPTTARNLRDFGVPALVSHNAGINLYMASNPGWRRAAFLRPGLPFRELALQAEPHRRNVAERDAYWRQRALAEIREHPTSWLASVAVRAYWSLHTTEIPRNEDYRCRLDQPALAWMRALPVRYGLVLPLAVLGVASVVARRDREGGLAVGLWAALHLPMLFFLVADRYRLASWPLLCLLAPLGIPVLAGLVQRRSRWLVAVGALALLPWLPIDPVVHKQEAWCRHVEGNLAYMEQDFARARALYEESLALDEDNPSARTYLAAIHQRERRYNEAIAHILPVVRAYPDHYPTLKLASDLHRQAGDLSAAADYMGRAYRVPGERTSSGLRYIDLLVQAGRRAEAVEVMRADPDLASHPEARKILEIE